MTCLINILEVSYPIPLSPGLVGLQIQGNSRLLCLTSCSNFVGFEIGSGYPLTLLGVVVGILVVGLLGSLNHFVSELKSRVVCCDYHHCGFSTTSCVGISSGSLPMWLPSTGKTMDFPLFPLALSVLLQFLGGGGLQICTSVAFGFSWLVGWLASALLACWMVENKEGYYGNLGSLRFGFFRITMWILVAGQWAFF